MSTSLPTLIFFMFTFGKSESLLHTSSLSSSLPCHKEIGNIHVCTCMWNAEPLNMKMDYKIVSVEKISIFSQFNDSTLEDKHFFFTSGQRRRTILTPEYLIFRYEFDTHIIMNIEIFVK